MLNLKNWAKFVLIKHFWIFLGIIFLVTINKKEISLLFYNIFNHFRGCLINNVAFLYFSGILKLSRMLQFDIFCGMNFRSWGNKKKMFLPLNYTFFYRVNLFHTTFFSPPNFLDAIETRNMKKSYGLARSK